MQQGDPFLTETISMCASGRSLSRKSSAICARLIQHRHPSTLKEQLIPIAEIAVRTREGIHLWNENLDIETALPQVAQMGLHPL
jgi:hypothetical protein